jgi:nucleoside-diphosphate-sugar epimerase
LSQKKIILITGAAGFIGKHIVSSLDSFRFQVVLTDILPKLYGVNSKVHYYKCDLTKEDDIKRLVRRLKGKIVLVHLAAYVPKFTGKKGDLATKNIKVNINGTINLVNNLANKLCKICFISTLETYGKPIYTPIDESHPTNPYSLYGLSKLIAEKYLMSFCRKNKIPLSILRFSSVYGPGELYDRAIPNFIRQALAGKPVVIFGNGLDVRDYVYVSDAVDAIISSVNKKNSHGLFNIASGRGYTVKNIARLIIKISGSKSTIIFSPKRKDSYDLTFDIALAKKKINFSPKVSINQGLRKEIDWFRACR